MYASTILWVSYLQWEDREENVAYCVRRLPLSVAFIHRFTGHRLVASKTSRYIHYRIYFHAWNMFISWCTWILLKPNSTNTEISLVCTRNWLIWSFKNVKCVFTPNGINPVNDKMVYNNWLTSTGWLTV